MQCEINKLNDDKQYIFGWASVAQTRDGREVIDWQGDAIAPEELEEAAYRHVLEFRSTGEKHDPALRSKGTLIESVVFTPEKVKAMGIPEGAVPVGWWVGYHIDDAETWGKVKSGEYKMFSIEGTGERVDEASEAEAEVGKVSRALTFEEALKIVTTPKKAMLFDEVIEKWNHSHDRLGRFARRQGNGRESRTPGTRTTTTRASISPKQQKKINEFKKRLRTGYADTVKLRRKGGIDKHDPGKAEFGKYAQMRKAAGKSPQSVFSVKPESLEKEVRERLKKKDVDVKCKGIDELYAVIKLDRAIGKSYDSTTKQRIDTSELTVVFSERDGMHYYPSLGDE